jgi:hypothetical protein
LPIVAQSVHPNLTALVLEPSHEILGYFVPQRHEVPGRLEAELPLRSPQNLDPVPAGGGFDVVGQDQGRILAFGPWRQPGRAQVHLRPPRRAPTAQS